VNGTLTCRPCRSGVHLNSFFRSATSCNLSHSHSPPPPPLSHAQISKTLKFALINFVSNFCFAI
jgi:hypothetical protein